MVETKCVRKVINSPWAAEVLIAGLLVGFAGSLLANIIWAHFNPPVTQVRVANGKQ